MKLVKGVFISLFFILNLNPKPSNIKTFTLKKGEVFDVIFLTIKPNKDDALKDYFKTISPMAKAYTFKPLFSSRIAKHTLGNLQPQIFYVAHWDNLDKRLQFVKDVTTKIPDFHERRQDIWNMFYLTYWELKEDITLTIDTDKYHAVTLFWNKNKADISYQNQWETLAKKHNVKQIITLTNGQSPLGYYHAPDYFAYSEFENEAAFKAFQKEAEKLATDSLEHYQQFVLE